MAVMQAYQNKSYDLDEGSAVFSFNLALKAPSEFKRLSQLARQIERSSSSSGGGFWEAIGTLILGFAVADWLFDDD